MFLDERIDRVSRNSIECADLEITDLGMRLPIVRQNHVERGVELGFRVVQLGHQESRRTGGAIARILRPGRSRATFPTTVRTIHTLHPTNGVCWRSGSAHHDLVASSRPRTHCGQYPHCGQETHCRPADTTTPTVAFAPTVGTEIAVGLKQPVGPEKPGYAGPYPLWLLYPQWAQSQIGR